MNCNRWSHNTGYWCRHYRNDWWPKILTTDSGIPKLINSTVSWHYDSTSLTLTADPPFFSFPLPSSSPLEPDVLEPPPPPLAFFLGGMTPPGNLSLSSELRKHYRRVMWCHRCARPVQTEIRNSKIVLRTRLHSTCATKSVNSKIFNTHGGIKWRSRENDTKCISSDPCEFELATNSTALSLGISFRLIRAIASAHEQWERERESERGKHNNFTNGKIFVYRKMSPRGLSALDV